MFSNAYRFLAKSALTAFALIAATFTANAAEVISINFANGDARMVTGTDAVTDVVNNGITADAWINVAGSENNGSTTSNLYWNGSAAANYTDSFTITWRSRNLYQRDGDNQQVYQRGYLDDGEHDGTYGPVITVQGIKFDAYDVVVYQNSDNASGWRPVTVNGVSYTYANGATVAGNSNWGDNYNGLELGRNAIRISGLCGTLNIQGGQSNGGRRGCISAIQIVKSENAATTVPGTDFSYGPNPATMMTGWFTAWKEGYGNNRMIGPEGVDALAVGDKYPYQAVTGIESKSAFTIAAIVNVDNVKPGDDEYAIVWSVGNLGAAKLGLMLTKHGENLYLQQVYKRNSANYRFNPYTGTGSSVDTADMQYCVAENVGAGYHLVVAVFDEAGQGNKNTTDVSKQRLALFVDGVKHSNVNPIATNDYLEKVSDGGLQLGTGYAFVKDNTDGLVSAPGAAFDRVMAWDSALTDDQQTMLWNQYSAVVQKPVVPSYQSDFGSNGATIYVPDMTTDAYNLSVSKGTMKIPEGTSVTVPSIRLANSDNSASVFGLDIDGTVTVTSTSTQPSAYLDQNNVGKLGVLLGHYRGTGTINVKGTLAATNAFIQTIQDKDNHPTLNIIGGTVTGRGLYAYRPNSSINISEGGVLEFATYVEATYENNLVEIPLTAGEGTIRAIQSGTYTTGWTYPSTVTFTDAAVGTTLDPNGLTVSFTGAASGAGKIIVNDTSANANGTVTIANAANITGTFSVVNGVLYLPDTYTPDLDANTKEDTGGAITGYKKYVNSSYAPQPVASVNGQDFYTVAKAIESLGGAAGTVTLLANAAVEDITLEKEQVIDTAGYAIGTVTAANGAILGFVNGIYTAYANDTDVEEVWTGLGANDRWTTADNWSRGFVPLATTPVTFPAKEGGWTVTLATGGNATEQCKKLTIVGNVQFNRAASSWTELYINGDIDGDGTLTLNSVGFRNMADANLEIKCPLVITGGDTVIRAQDINGYGWTISKSLTLRGYLKVQNAKFINVTCPTVIEPSGTDAYVTTLGLITTLTFSDKVTLGDNVKIDHWSNGVYFGEVEVTGDASFTNQSQCVHLDGEVTVDAGKTLTIPANINFGENASFTLAGAGSKIVDGKGSLAGVTCSLAGYTALKINDTWVAAVTWTSGANDRNWGNAGNWSNNAVPDKTTPVAFTSSAVVNMGAAAHDCAGMFVPSDVSVEIVGGTTACDLNLYDHVAGSGTLTLTGSGLKNRIAGTTLLVAPNVVFRNAPGVEKDPQPWLATGVTNYGITINGDVTFVDEFKSWDTTHTIVGTTTFSGQTFKLAGNNVLRLGVVNVTNSVVVTSGATLAFTGKTTIAGGKTLEIPAQGVTIGDNATFELAGFGATLVDNGGLVAEDKVTTPIVKGAKISITTDGSKKTYKLSLVGMTIILR